MTHIYFLQRVQRIIVVGPAKTFHAKYTFNLDIWIRQVWKMFRRRRRSRFNGTQLLAVVVVVAFILSHYRSSTTMPYVCIVCAYLFQ